jgi:stress response protein SCP2
MSQFVTKGQIIYLNQPHYDLSEIHIGLGWDVQKSKMGHFLQMLFDYDIHAQKPFDLDAVLFVMQENDKVISLGNEHLQGGDVIFFDNTHHPSGNIWLTNDAKHGEGTGEHEEIVIRLNSLPRKYQKLMFLVSIYKGISRKHHLGMLKNAYIRLSDAKGVEILRFHLEDNTNLKGMYSLLFAELYREDGLWAFHALGEAHPSDRFTNILQEYVYV